LRFLNSNTNDYGLKKGFITLPMSAEIKKSALSSTIATGFAMFSMFFGAGNVVFPLAIGQYAKNQNLFAILGLLITAVGVPFLGLIAMTLYNGNYKAFF
jgi:LIVCS family branched-chain amino acid:cation transporter